MRTETADAMGLGGKSFLFSVGAAVIAGVSYFAQRDTEACAVLRKTLQAQQMMDSHREGPLDFAYVPVELATECGAEALRMPHPYKMRIGTKKTELQLQREFFNLKKPTVRVRDIRPFNENYEKLVASSIGAFTDNADRQIPFKEAHSCLGNGTCAMFFDNSWQYDDVKPMVPTTPGGSLDILFRQTRFGNMFCTNLTQSRMTARMHSAPYHGNIAVQMAGIKRWKFWNPAELGAWGIHPDESTFGTTARSIFQPFAGMAEVVYKIPHYEVTTAPGEFMYFPSHWTHVVWTDEGWNTMINLRMCFTLRTLFPAFANALQIHTAKGAFKILMANLIQYVVTDEFFRRVTANSKDKVKLGEGVAASAFNDFVSLNMENM